MLLIYLARDDDLKWGELHKGCDTDFPQKGLCIGYKGKNAGRKESGKEGE